MTTLHILRTEPDDMVRMLIDRASGDGDSIEVPLYRGGVDYDDLTKAIFASDQVISWW
jgi:hypothetical protein